MALFPVLRAWLDGGEPEPAPSRASSLMDWPYGLGLPLQTTWGENKADPINGEFADYVEGGLKANGIISAIEQVRFSVFAEARFQFQSIQGGRTGDLFGNTDLTILERPWQGGTTGDLLAGMLLDADLGGNAYRIRVGDELVRLRPDWVEIILADRPDPNADPGEEKYLGYQKLGYVYWHGGKLAGGEPTILNLDEVAHFAPYPDPNASFRGMSWLTPVIREIQSDKQATEHKARLFENAATPNLHVNLKDVTNLEKFNAFVDQLEQRHAGAANAYKTMYTAGGTDVTVLGANMQQLDYKSIVGAGETRLAAAAGVHPVILGLSEGMQGSSLNAGNYTAAKRRFVDATMRPLWRNVCGSLEVLVPAPSTPGGSSRLWYDDRDIAFLREDIKDRADTQFVAAQTIRQLVDAGYVPDSVVKAVNAEDMSLLVHSNLFSVQLQAPGTSPPMPEAPRTEVTIAEGAIRTEVHPPAVDIDARMMPGAVNASSSNNPTEAVEGVIERTAEKMADAIDDVLARRSATDAERDEAAALAAESRAAEWVELNARVVGALEEMRAEVAKPRRKTVKTDEIGRITAIIEEPVE